MHGDKRALRPRPLDPLPHQDTVPIPSVGMAAEAAPIAATVTPSVQPATVDLEALREEAFRQVREEMQAEATKLAQAAQTRGYEEGLKQAAQQVAQEAEQRAAKIQTLLESITEHCRQALTGTEELAAQIAYETVCKIAGEHLITTNGVLAIAQKAIEAVGQQAVLKIRVSPQDLALLAIEDASTPSSSVLTWMPDERIQAGGCIVETTLGELDARLDGLLAKTRQALLSARESRRV
ncbi:FliH/SctL family protein [Chitinimonas sp. PSY-7]|uniref:FliH/SctL family protein n=1 Tax=Chitinimonas sp. PSY-7 TaxID=3459088 RepID=UPI00403FD03F